MRLTPVLAQALREAVRDEVRNAFRAEPTAAGIAADVDLYLRGITLRPIEEVRALVNGLQNIIGALAPSLGIGSVAAANEGESRPRPLDEASALVPTGPVEGTDSPRRGLTVPMGVGAPTLPPRPTQPVPFDPLGPEGDDVLDLSTLN